MERFNDPIEDGFESGNEEKLNFGEIQAEEHKQPQLTVDDHMIKLIPPPQQIKDKAYSLHPDMLTGWMPKVSLPKPIPLTFPQSHIAELITPYFRQKPSQIQLIYLGPRFDTTYSAWKVYGVDFPYNHLGNQKINVSDRQFHGMVKHYPRDGVRFQSQFESGNLDAVFKVGQKQFDCFMRVDANTRGHLQWYYFKMFNIKQNEKYKLNICNFQKGKTLYTRGMKPYIYSHKKNEEESQGWRQQGDNVEYENKKSKTYRCINGKSEEEQNQFKYYTLSFEVSSQYHDDIIQIAYCPPYTFTKLNTYLKQLLNANQQRNILCQDSLCLTLSGFKIPLLTLTNDAKQVQSQFKQKRIFRDKNLIFVMARIHPGQSNGSYVMEGFLKWLCGYSKEAQELRSKFVFKIIPMVNPDGVVIGNYRTGLSGRDFNRQFTDPDPSLFIEVFQLRKYVQKCKWIYQKNFNFFLDFHGHSVKKSAFSYGPQFPLSHSKYYESRLLPKLISKRTDIFRYYSCTFNITPCKKTTARAIALKSFGIPYTYTIEASNGSYFDYQLKQKLPFTIDQWVLLGVKICEAISDYWIIQKQIQEVRQKRKKQRQAMLKGKGSVTRKIQSSSFRSKSSGTNKTRKINFKSAVQRIQTKSSNILNQILIEIAQQTVKQEDKCSDDNLSQGKSDSQNSQDDIDMTIMKTMITGKSQTTRRAIRRVKTKQQHKVTENFIKENAAYKHKIIRHSSSFLTQLQQQSPEPIPKKHPFLQKRKRPFLHKKIYTMSGSSVSPPQNRNRGDPNGTAKIINLSFMLNPIPTSGNIISINQKREKMKTQMGQQNMQKQQFSQFARKTYQSIQRDSFKKEMSKRMSMNQNLASGQFKNQQVVGKRIFTEY